MLNGLFIWLRLGHRAPLSHSRDISLGAILRFRVPLMGTLGCSKQGRGIKLRTTFWATATPTPTNAVASAPALGGQHTFSYPNLIWFFLSEDLLCLCQGHTSDIWRRSVTWLCWTLNKVKTHKTWTCGERLQRTPAYVCLGWLLTAEPCPGAQSVLFFS